VLVLLQHYTHCVAISNRRIIKANATAVTFKVKNYRVDGPARYTTMTLHPNEFIRRFLLHVLPKGLHRIRHYGLFANGGRADNLARIRVLLDVTKPCSDEAAGLPEPDAQETTLSQPCPCCGGQMRIIEVFEAGMEPRTVVTPAIPPEGIDSSWCRLRLAHHDSQPTRRTAMGAATEVYALSYVGWDRSPLDRNISAPTTDAIIDRQPRFQDNQW